MSFKFQGIVKAGNVCLGLYNCTSFPVMFASFTLWLDYSEHVICNCYSSASMSFAGCVKSSGRNTVLQQGGTLGLYH